MAFERIKEVYEVFQIPTRFRVTPLEIAGAALGTGAVAGGFINAIAGQETVGGYVITAGSLVYAGVGASITKRFRPLKFEEVNLPPSHEAFETHDIGNDDLLSQFPDIEKNFHTTQDRKPENPKDQ